MSPLTNRNIVIGMFAGVVLGAVAGAVIPDAMLLFGVVGRLFVNALQILLLPLIPAVIIAGVAGLGHAPKLGRAAVSTVLYFIATTAIAVVIGTVLVLVFNPGGSATPTGAFIPEMVARARATSVADVFAAFVPDNLVGSLGSGQYLGLVVLSLVFGAVICAMGPRAKIVVDFFKAIADITLHIATYVLYAAPIGLFVLVGSAVARNPEAISSAWGNLLWLTITFLLAIALHGLVVLPLMLKFMGHRNPVEYGGKTMPALMTAFGTASSAAALPVTFRNVVDDSDVDARAGSIVLPLGVSMNANGTAIYLVIAALFTAQLFGLSLSVFQVIAIALLSILLSLGTAGAPGMALFSLAILFSALQFPVEAYGVIGLLVVVDWLFDRGRAVLNAWGDMVGAAIIGESFEFKTARVSRTVAEGPAPRRERTPDRRERRPSEGRPSRESTRERTPRGRGRTDRPARPDRSGTERTARTSQEAKPAEPRREREAETRRETPAPSPVRAAVPPREGSRRGEGRGGRRGRGTDRGERSERPERRERTERPEGRERPERVEALERAEQAEPRVQQPPTVGTEEGRVVEERPRIVPPPIPPRPEREKPAPTPEPEAEQPRPTPEPERVVLPEIRRRPLPMEREEEPTSQSEKEVKPEVEFAAPREPESRPEPPQPPEERERPRELSPEREEIRPPEPPAPKEDREPYERREEPNLRDLLTNLSVNRERRQETEEQAEREQPEATEQPSEEPRTERPVSFGRGKSRHGVRPSGQSASGDEPGSGSQSETPEERKDGFPADQVTSFGRSRRRKGH